MMSEIITRRELAANTHCDFKMYECVLKSGCHYESDLFPLSDKMQMFFFINPTGYVATKNRAWNIVEPSLFVPNYDKEKFWIEAGSEDLKFIHFTGIMNAYDQKEYIDYHIILPNMRRVSQGFKFAEYYTGNMGSTIECRRLVLDTAFGRWFVGINDGKDDKSFVANHVHEHLHQWNYVLPNSKFKYKVNGDEKVVEEGMAYYVPKGAEHSAYPIKNEGIHYLWIKFASEGFPVGKDGYPGSEE